MRCTTEIFGDVIVVHAPEELANEQAAQFEKYLESIERPRVVLDMDHTESLDSAGLAGLLNAFDHLHPRGGDLKIATSNAANRKILELTRLDQQLEVFDTVIDAVKSFRN